MARAKAFSTTRQVRRLLNGIRQWMRADPEGYVDAGSLSVAEAQAWTAKYIADKPGDEFPREWQKAGQAVHDLVWIAWPHLRGPTKREHAEAAARYNQRAIDRNPLFATMGALDEVSGLKTADAILAQQAINEASNRERDKSDAQVRERRKHFRMALSFVRTGTGLSIDELLVWRHFLTYGGPYRPSDWLSEAKSELGRITGGDPLHTAGLIDGIEDYFISKGIDERPNMKEALDVLRSLRPAAIEPQLCRLQNVTIKRERPVFLKELPMAKAGVNTSPGQLTFTM